MADKTLTGMLGVAFAALVVSSAIAQEAAFHEGHADRQAFETWFNGLSDTYRAGAEFWAGHRSDPTLPV